MDKKKVWIQVDEIIKVLNAGCVFLDFPLEKNLEDYIISDQDQLEKDKEEINGKKKLPGRVGGLSISTHIGNSPIGKKDGPLKLGNLNVQN